MYVTFSVTCWFYSTSLQSTTRLQSTVKVCCKIIRLLVRSVSTVCMQHILRTALRILQNPLYTLFSVFQWLLSGRQVCYLGCRTQRRRTTFVPRAFPNLNPNPFIRRDDYPDMLAQVPPAPLHKVSVCQVSVATVKNEYVILIVNLFVFSCHFASTDYLHLHVYKILNYINTIM